MPLDVAQQRLGLPDVTVKSAQTANDTTEAVPGDTVFTVLGAAVTLGDRVFEIYEGPHNAGGVLKFRLVCHTTLIQHVPLPCTFTRGLSVKIVSGSTGTLHIHYRL